MKKAFLVASLAMASLSSSVAWAQGISVTVNGNPVAFPKQGPIQAPDGSILVPLREVFEALGTAVQFLPQTRTITASRGNTNISLQLGESVGYVNGKPKSLPTPAQNIAGTTMLPLRFISEAFGADVKWDATVRQVAIALAGAKPLVKTGVGVTSTKPTPAEEKPIIIPVKGLTPDEIKPVTPPVTLTAVPTGSVVGNLTALTATSLTLQADGGLESERCGRESC
jgi:Copper amine oxidase N-terminal domain